MGPGNIYERKKLSELRHMGSALLVFFPFVIASMDQRKRLHLQFASQQLVRDDLV
jgi:hypothetical protein